PGARWSNNDIARIVAVPLEAAGVSLGVLAAGFRNEPGSLAIAERLELRASLAATALDFRRPDIQAAPLGAEEQVVLDVTNGATILVDDGSRIAGISRGAQDLCREMLGAKNNGGVAGGDSEPEPPIQFQELFRMRDQKNVADWIGRIHSGHAV